MPLLRLLVASLLVLAVTPPAAAAADSRVGSVAVFAEQSFAAGNVPGMVIVATQGNETVLARAFGVDGRGDPMTLSTPLRVASLTKTVTSVAVHQLVDEGLVRLDDPVVGHLPEFRMSDPRHTRITIQQLLDNRSGLRDDQFDLDRLNRAESLEAYVAGLSEASLAVNPGAAQTYCNVNWEVLARMVEVVTEEPFAMYLQRQIFDPLGMKDSTVAVSAADAPGGYQELFGFHFARDDDLLFAASSGSNGLITTAADLVRWTRWVASGSGAAVLAPATRQGMIERARHLGSTDGFEGHGARLGKSGMQHTELTQLRFDPDSGSGATVVVNVGDVSVPVFALADGAVDALQGDPVGPVGSQWRVFTLAYAVASLALVAAAAVGVRNAGSWSHRRRAAGRWLVPVRLGWLMLPSVGLMTLPLIVSALTMGTRTISWAQASYLLLSPLVILTLGAAAGVAVLLARLVALRSERLDHHTRAQQLTRREAEDASDRVTEVRG